MYKSVMLRTNVVCYSLSRFRLEFSLYAQNIDRLASLGKTRHEASFDMVYIAPQHTIDIFLKIPVIFE